MKQPIIRTLGPLGGILFAFTAHASPSGEINLGDVAEAVLGAAPVGGPTEDRFSFTIAAGDFDGDGHRDVAVGAPRIDRVYVFRGPMTAPIQSLLQVDAVYEGTPGGEAGWSLAMDDINDDGRDELLVGEPSAVGGAGIVKALQWPFAGQLHPSLVKLHDEPGAELISFVGPNTKRKAFAGWDVSTGDFDGDGLQDVIIGACEASDDDPELGDPWTGSNGFRRQLGAVYMMSQKNMQYTSSMLLEHTATATYWGLGNTGCSVDSAGDFDGDGIEDMVFGSFGLSVNAAVNSGAGHIVLGGPSLPSVTRLAAYDAEGGPLLTVKSVPGISTVLGSRKGGNLGLAVAGAGDLNADGFDDVLFGAPAEGCAGCGNNYLHDGRAYLLLGGTGLQGTSVVGNVASGEFIGPDDARVGRDLAAAGDVDGDGADDLLIGSGANAGYLIYGEYDPSSQATYACGVGGNCTVQIAGGLPSLQGNFQIEDADAVFRGDHADAFAGFSVAGLGDVTDDGSIDLAFGAPFQLDYNDHYNENGLLYVVPTQ